MYLHSPESQLTTINSRMSDAYGFDKAARDRARREADKFKKSAIRLEPEFPYAVEEFPIDFFGFTADTTPPEEAK